MLKEIHSNDRFRAKERQDAQMKSHQKKSLRLQSDCVMTPLYYKAAL